jgi:hypothetical protein
MTNQLIDNISIEEDSDSWIDEIMNSISEEDMYDEMYPYEDDAALEEYSLASTYGYEY